MGYSPFSSVTTENNPNQDEVDELFAPPDPEPTLSAGSPFSSVTYENADGIEQANREKDISDAAGGESPIANLTPEQQGDISNPTPDEPEAPNTDIEDQFNTTMGEMGDMLKAAEANSKDQLGAVRDRASENSRRGAEIIAMQGGSQFGGNSGAKQIQAQMATNEFERQIRNDNFEMEHGIRKGMINLRTQKWSKDIDNAHQQGNMELAGEIAAEQSAFDGAMRLYMLDPESFEGTEFYETMMAQLEGED